MFEKYIKLLTYKRKSSSSPILSSYSARFSIKLAKFHYTPLPPFNSRESNNPIERIRARFETGSQEATLHTISIHRHGYVGGAPSIRLDPADLRNKISGWTRIFVSVGWRSLFAPSIHRVRGSAPHNPRLATVSRVCVRFKTCVAGSHVLSRALWHACTGSLRIIRARFALQLGRRFEGETERQLSVWKKEWKRIRFSRNKVSWLFPFRDLTLFFSLFTVRHFHFIRW